MVKSPKWCDSAVLTSTLFRLKFHRFGEIKRYGVMIRVAIRKILQRPKSPDLLGVFHIFYDAYPARSHLQVGDFHHSIVSLKSAVESQYLQLCEKTVKS